MPKLDRIDPATLQHNPRASLAAWSRYERIAVAAFRQHPRPYTCRSNTHAASAVATRLRDAIRGAICFGYPIANGEISTADLTSWWGETIVKPCSDHVIVGPPKAVIEEMQISREDPRAFSFHDLTLDELIAFTVLLSSGRIEGPVTVYQPPDISQLPPRDNVELLSRPDGSLVLM